MIANIEGKNSNVMYELGIAHTMNKQVILACKTKLDIPLDLAAKRFILYSTEHELEVMLARELLKLQNEQKKATD